MPPVIRISDDTWEMLKIWAVPLEDSADDALRKALRAANEHRKCSNLAQPLEDSANDALRKALDTDKVPLDIAIPAQPSLYKTDTNGSKPKRERLPRGKKAPQKVYEFPILETLYQLGGRAQGKDVLPTVERKMKHLLSDVDYQVLSDGRETRWRKTANFARLELRKRGLLRNDSEWGIWELTEQGIAEVTNSKDA